MAYADPIGEFFANLTGNGAEARAFSDHAVDTVTPHGTTINLFDYWVYERDSDDYGNPTDTNINNPDSGINAGHAFDFSTGSYDSYNKWHRMPTRGIVENELGADGYPVLAASSGIDAADLESLAYLFNSNDETTAEKVAGKRAFSNVGGLLQVDSNGYYYYDSTENFASFDEGTNTFSVYDTAAVRTNESDLSSNGQFFPFNTAADVFNESNGQLVEKDPAIRAKSTDLNHWFGASMTTRFVQPTGGLTAKNEDVTYHFSGDDDVWVYIDGVLVGDLGGVHSKADLDINFRTGEVEVTGVDGLLYETTLKALFDAAGMSTEGWEGDTFPDESLHTLKFFYLERGSADSNMSLKFNLVTVPESTIVKVDQDGNPVADATFRLYAADEDYNTTSAVLAEGTTDSSGRITLVDSTDTLITFEDLYNHNNRCTHYVLEEVSAPAGYRLSGDIHIEYSPQSGVVYSTNYWETGAYANASESITSPTEMQVVKNGQVSSDKITINGTDLQYNNETPGGTLFAVVLHRDGTGGITDARSWRGVYGSTLEEGGWKLTDTTTADFAGVIEAAQKGGAHEFAINSNGLFQADIGELPGNIQKYFWVMGDTNETEYVVSFYYTTADSAKGATVANTVLVNNPRDGDSAYDNHEFRRQFAATFNVPDMHNRLLVQKVDENGTPVVGAEFTLYSQNPTDNPRAAIVGTVTTRNLSKEQGDALDLEGANFFEGKNGLVANKNEVTGEITGKRYWLKETSAPAGYQVNDEVIEVYVDGTGVYANAGEANDGVTVLRGTGTLAKTMAQFATNVDIDTTLHDIKLTLQTGDPTAENPGWTDVAGTEEVHLSYGAENAALEYGPAEEGGARSVQSDTGWPLARITQCYQHDSSVKTDNKTNLATEYFGNDNYNLRSLFSGTATVRVANQQVNDLEISKTVIGYEGMDAAKLADLQSKKEFQFTLNLTFPDNAVDPNAEYALNVLDAKGNKVGESVSVVKNGDTSFTLKNGQKAVVEDLPVGVTYTVTENEPTGGFASTPDKGNDVDATVDADKRTISGNLADADNNADNNTTALTPVAVSYTNTYAPNATKVSNLGIAKTITNADETSPYTWGENDSYEFWLVSYPSTNGESSPLPAEGNGVTHGTTPGNLPYAAVKITSQDDSKEKGFGEITFTKPGTYKYLIREESRTEGQDGYVAGIDYSRADYEVIIEVKDVGDGSMTATTMVKQVHDDKGVELGGDFEQKDEPLVLFAFSNTYAMKSVQWGPEASKAYSDLTGSKPLADDMFTFKVELGNGAPELSGLQISPDGGYYTTQNDLSFIEMGSATFNDVDHKGVPYTYTVTEMIPDEAINLNVNNGNTFYKDAADDQQKTAGWIYNGMTYDSSVWTIEVTADYDANDIFGVTAVYKKDDVAVNDPLLQRVVFNNSYDAEDLVLSGDTAIKGTKTLEGRDSKEGETFTFELSAPTGSSTATALLNDSIVLNGDPAASTLTQPIRDGLENGVAKGFSFDNITFKKVGTYVFNIKETGFGADGSGMTWDRHTAAATVKVKENNGVLELDGPVVYSDGADASAAAFVNRYAATGSVTVQGTKAIDGRAFKGADDFSFAVASAATNPKLSGLNSQGILAPSYVASTSSQTLDFGTITFTKPGSYTYTFSEVIPDGGVKDGVTYDTTVHKLEIDVKDNLDGTLSVEFAALDGLALTDADLNNEIFDIAGIAWTNTYAASGVFSGADNLKVTKALEGRDWKDGDSFTFTIEPYNAGDTADTVTAVTRGDVVMSNPTELTIAYSDVAAGTNSATKAFGAITFNKTTVSGKPYAFKITEAQTGNGQNGMTYDTHERIVYVTVTDNGDGTLKTEMVRPAKGSDTWTNKYEAGELDAKVEVDFTKVFNGWNTNQAFDDTTFSFKITPLNGAPAPTSDMVTVSKPETGIEATFGFGSIVFKASDLGGATSKSFEYEVAEIRPTEDDDPATPGIQKDGITYDDNKAKVTVTVTDGGMGTLAAVASVADGEFENTYSSSLNYAAAGGLAITKTLNGRDMAANQFAFTVTPQAGTNTTAADAKAKLGIDDSQDAYKVTAANNGLPSSIDVLAGKTATFTQDDAGKTYVYKINETTAGDEGYTNDTAERTVTISVKDNGNATLTVITTVSGGTEGEKTFSYTTGQDVTEENKAVVPFVNAYDEKSIILGGEGEVSLNATKTLTGRDQEAGEFKFEIANVKNGDLVASGTTTVAAADGKKAQVEFDPITYTTQTLDEDYKAGANDREAKGDAFVYRYAYKVAEKATSSDLPAGVAGGKTEFSVSVYVTDDGKGNLSIAVEYPNQDNELAFTNTYGSSAEAKVSVSGVKTLTVPEGATYTAPDLDIKGKFTFTLTAPEGTPMPATTSVVNGDAGAIDFGNIVYTMSNVFGSEAAVADGAAATSAQRSKTFEYTITESLTDEEVPGVSLAAEKNFKVAVTDLGDGTLKAEVIEGESQGFAFENVYSVEPIESVVTDQIAITKKLDGRDMAAGEFNFELVEVVDGAETVVATGANAADGTVTFEAITYSAPGEHDYLVREVAGDKGGVTYDTRTFLIHTSVTDNGDGTLSATHVSVSRDAVSFVNAYEAKPATVNLGAAKLLNNAKPGDARFTFQVLDKDGNVVAEAQNNEEGAVKFPALTFDAAGEYDYTIVEVNDGQEGVTYDEGKTAVKVVVSATDAGGNYTGQLHSSIEYADGTPLFSNAYTEPEDPSEPGGGKPGGSEPPALPDTSDNLGPLVIGLGTLAVIACAGLVIGAVKMRRKSGSHRAK